MDKKRLNELTGVKLNEELNAKSIQKFLDLLGRSVANEIKAMFEDGTYSNIFSDAQNELPIDFSSLEDDGESIYEDSMDIMLKHLNLKQLPKALVVGKNKIIKKLK